MSIYDEPDFNLTDLMAVIGSEVTPMLFGDVAEFLDDLGDTMPDGIAAGFVFLGRKDYLSFHPLGQEPSPEATRLNRPSPNSDIAIQLTWIVSPMRPGRATLERVHSEGVEQCRTARRVAAVAKLAEAQAKLAEAQAEIDAVDGVS